MDEGYFQFIIGLGGSATNDGGLGMLQALDGRFLDDQGLALDAELLSGARIIAEAADLPNKMKKADWVVTGEGRSDFQSLYGKALVVVAKMAKSRTSFI